jgi:hypothetical protein
MRSQILDLRKKMQETRRGDRSLASLRSEALEVRKRIGRRARKRATTDPDSFPVKDQLRKLQEPKGKRADLGKLQFNSLWGTPKAKQKQYKKAWGILGNIMPKSVFKGIKKRLETLMVSTDPDMNEAISASYDPGAKTIWVSRSCGTAEFAHEFGHFLEDVMPGWQTKAGKFRKKRAAGEKIGPLRGYKGAVGYNDKFKNPYAGRVYKGHKETEIISHGIEQLVRNPAGFAKSDPEYFDFIYNLLKTGE